MPDDARTPTTPSPARADLAHLVETTPPSGPHRGVGAVAAVATLGSLLFGYDTGVISGALPYMAMPTAAHGLALTPVEEGAVGGVLTLGAAAGALAGGYLSDRYGRRHNLILLAVVFVVGALGTALAPSVEVLYPFRLILGLAVGGASATVPVYLSETAPKRVRGTVVALDQLMIVTGQLLAFTMNAAIAGLHGGPSLTVTADPSGLATPGTYLYSELTALRTASMSDADWQAYLAQLVVEAGNGSAWRWMLVLCSLPAVSLWIGIRLMPESARWYVTQGRLREAVAALRRVRDEDADGPLLDEVTELVQALERDLAGASRRRGLGYVMRVPWLRRLLAVGVLLAVVNQTTGVNTVMYYAPKVLQYAGMSTSAAITAQVANGLMSVVGAAAGLWLIARFGRRTLLVADVWGVAACLLAVSATFATVIGPHMEVGTVPPAWAAWLVLALMSVFMLVVQSSNGTVVWTMLGEVFPSHVRGAMSGAAICCNWLANAAITWTFPSMMASWGGARTYAVFGVLNVLVGLVLLRVMPETRGLSLEEVEVRVRERYSRPGERLA